MGFWNQHSQHKNATRRAKAHASNRIDHLQNGVEVLNNHPTQDAVDSGKENEQFHNHVGPVLRVSNVWLDVVEVDNSSQGIDAGGKRAKGSTEHAGNKYTWHAPQVTYGILHEVRNHLVHLRDMTRLDGIAVVEAGVNHNACEAVEEHDQDKPEAKEHQRSSGVTQ